VPVFGAPTAGATTFGARIWRRHHPNLATPPRSPAPLPVMLIAAGGPRGVAHRQRHARRVLRKEALARETIGRGTGTFAWNYRDRVEFRFRRARLGGGGGAFSNHTAA